jgi:hypothetical protein
MQIQQQPPRKPVIREFNESYDDTEWEYASAWDYARSIFHELRPGDVIQSANGYRVEDMLVMGAHGVTCPLRANYDHAVLQAWLLQIGIDNGYKCEELLQIYGKTRAEMIVCPRNVQILNGLQIDDEANYLSTMWLYENEGCDNNGVYTFTEYLMTEDDDYMNLTDDCNAAMIFDESCPNPWGEEDDGPSCPP